MVYSYEWLYAAYDAMQAEAAELAALRARPRNPVQAFMQRSTGGARGGKDGFVRMQECRQALEALDGRGWQRSFHQRMFHDNFIRSCSRQNAIFSLSSVAARIISLLTQQCLLKGFKSFCAVNLH